MNILDLDLDFFQGGRIIDDAGSYSGSVTAWSPKEVDEYLANNLNLRGKKIKGRIFEKHDEVYYFWKELISKGLLTSPFHVDHIDAHSDLGVGYSNGLWDCFFNDYMKNYFSNRNNFPTNEMNEGNYLCYAIAQKWLTALNYVYNDTDDFNGSDFLHIIMDTLDYNGQNIQLRAFDGLTGSDLADAPCYIKQKEIPSQKDPIVPFKRIAGSKYFSTMNYDFISLAISPQYIIKNSYNNIGVIAQYIDII